MKTLFFVYIPIFIFSLSFIANGLKTEKNADEITLPTRTEQLSESDEFTNCYAPLSPGLHLGADEGVVTPTGRRFGLNKAQKTNVYSHHNIYGGKNIPVKLSFARERRHFIQYLTTRHSQGFYIYSLQVLLL